MTMRFNCYDCPKGPVEWFMLTNRVWRAATRDNRGVKFCLSCVEKRLDRALAYKDFLRDALCNFGPAETPELYVRMRGLEPSERLVVWQRNRGMPQPTLRPPE